MNPRAAVPRWFRILIALHPREFRERFGAEMADAVAAMLSHSRERRTRVADWWFLTRDLVSSAARERFTTPGTP